jgi:hypothetical protein
MVAGMGCKTLASALADATLAVFALFYKIVIRAGAIAVQTCLGTQMRHELEIW